jgi:hypothetical protein
MHVDRLCPCKAIQSADIAFGFMKAHQIVHSANCVECRINGGIHLRLRCSANLDRNKRPERRAGAPTAI